jgi:hypothetical protein
MKKMKEKWGTAVKGNHNTVLKYTPAEPNMLNCTLHLLQEVDSVSSKPPIAHLAWHECLGARWSRAHHKLLSGRNRPHGSAEENQADPGEISDPEPDEAQPPLQLQEFQRRIQTTMATIQAAAPLHKSLPWAKLQSPPL